MSLPLVIDIAIGLLFIYLTLSLLTSEIQELIATLLQWRAEHLKKSIENLLIGNETDDPLYRKFVDDLYNSPLIRSLNQEARGLLAGSFRKISHSLGAAYRSLTGTSNIFGQHHSGPSYIPPSTFSTALLQKINVGELSQKISILTAKQFRDASLESLREILQDLRTSLGDDPFLVGNGSLLEKQFSQLEHSLEMTLADFISGRATLAQSFEQIAEQLSLFIDHAHVLLSEDHPCKEVIRRRLTYLKQSILRQRLEPTITEVLRLIFAEEEGQNVKPSPWASEIFAEISQNSPELLHPVIRLPLPLRNSLLSLANQARIKARNLEEEVRELEQEVAIWFSQSMDRASGVYRRNAKGIAILIGFLVAIAINADTLHILDRLSRDSVVRSTLTTAADQVLVRSAPNPGDPAVPSETRPPDLQTMKAAVDEVLDELPLPLGWNAVNMREQTAASIGWDIPILRRLLGWLITGIALSMGATFWFDLLNKVVRVRSTGNKPDDRPSL